ncbi:hypothetical protein E0L36_26660 [Streptomyces sp. AJS327]|uniref:hypothetical protein n=1 Tax=Streptomyces sp. AJS327 TaxID=2545265 RepID=UPI0015DEE035|nr:hypothetical protein [Streptomyces sp. AJS327]MBA0054303.1 hypothetical protein [Streptomyces sp. AJS327]
MPLFDTRGQQIPYPVLTDKPNAQTAFQNLVEASVPKMVMTFASASVRGATIPDPTAGMVCWLADVKRLEVYDGGAWVAFSTGTSAWTNIPLVSGYSSPNNADDNQQGPVQYRVVNLSGVDALMFRGGMHVRYVGGTEANNVGSLPNGGVFTNMTLPSHLWPAYRRTIPVACSAVRTTTTTAKLDVNTNGMLALVGINDLKDSPPWVSLNGAVCPL